MVFKERPVLEVGDDWCRPVGSRGNHLYIYFVNGKGVLDKGQCLIGDACAP